MRNTIAAIALATVAIAAIAAAANAQMKMGDAAAATSPSTEAYLTASAGMHDSMMITYSGNADIDFARGMIPHHQGAIDMARIELEFGTDPELRKVAEAIIAAQEAEIAAFQAWLAANDK